MSFSFHSFYGEVEEGQVARLKKIYLPLTMEEREKYFLTKDNIKGRWVAIHKDKFILGIFNNVSRMQAELVRYVSKYFMYYKDLVIFDRYTCKVYTFPELPSNSNPPLQHELKSFKDTVRNVIKSINNEDSEDSNNLWSGLKLW